MSPKGFVILHAHLSRIVHTCNALFYFGREAKAHLDVSTMALAPTRTPSTAGRDMRSVETNIDLTKRRICVQCNKHLSYQKRDEQSFLYWCCFYGHPIVSQIRMLKQLFCTELM